MKKREEDYLNYEKNKQMKIIELTNDRLDDFRSYCEKHKYDHDESFLDETELAEFSIGEENPTFLLVENHQIRGVLSLMRKEYFLRGERARIRIFHCETGDKNHYAALLQKILPLKEPVKRIEMFLPDKLTATQEMAGLLGFRYFRTAYVMSRRGKVPVAPRFPEGFFLTEAVPGKDEGIWAEIRNRAFSNLKGSETPLTAENVSEHFADPDILKGGLVILRHHEKPVGIIRMSREEDEEGVFSFVAPVALIPEYQGKGLGSELLKAGIAVGAANGLPDCMLSVNGENENALKLYRKNGFELDMSVSCFVYNKGTIQTGEPV